MKRLALLLILLTAPVACSSPRLTTEDDPVERPVVDRLGAESVRLRWPAAFATGEVRVYAGSAPDVIDRSRLLGVGRRGTLTLDTDDSPLVADTHRLYYQLVPADGAPTLTAERRLPLRGPDNFRDLGGYRTSDGRTVRWGRIFRSNELSDLTARDLQYLARLEVQLVCDFRSDPERRSAPNRTPEAPQPERLSLPIEEEGVDPKLMQEQIRTGGIAALGVERAMLDAYRSFVTRHSDQWAALLRRLAEPSNLPTVINCTAGKDRTGFGSALVLLTLGVPEETVFEDYLLTNDYRRDFRRFVLRWVPLYSLFRTDPEDLLPLLEARREYLQASLDAIAEEYGDLDGYLEQRLGVTPSLRAALETNLLR